MKKRTILAALVVGLCLMVCGCSSCKKTDEKNWDIGFSYDENVTATLNELYDPVIQVDNGTITSVVIKDYEGRTVDLVDSYKFVPDKYGEYTYTVTVENEKTERSFVFRVLVLDKNAPVIQTAPSDKNIEAGIYAGFADDLNELKFVDSNPKTSEYVTKKVISITYGEQSDVNEAGFTYYVFEKTGTYNIKIEVSNLAGYKSYTIYKITAVDTTAPEISVEAFSYARIANEKITIPVPTVHDYSSYTLSVKVNGTAAEIGSEVPASDGQEFNIEYSATDANGNTATENTVIKAVKSNVVLDNDERSLTLFSAENGNVSYNGGVEYYNGSAEDSLVYSIKASECNVEGYNALVLKLKNKTIAGGRMFVYALFGDSSTYLGQLNLNSVDNAFKDYTLYAGNINAKSINGLKFVTKNARNVNFVFDSVSVAKLNNLQGVESGLINFENDSDFAFSKVYGGGFTKVTDESLVIEGNNSAKATLKAGFSAGVIFKNGIKINREANYFTAKILSNTESYVKVKLLIDNANYSSGQIFLQNLSKGINEIGFFIDEDNLTADFKDHILNGITICSEDKFDNAVIIDSISFERKTSIQAEDVFKSVENNYELTTADSLYVDNVIKGNEGVIDHISVGIYKDGALVAETAIGEIVDLKNYAGEYEIKYKVYLLGGFGDIEKTLRLYVEADEFNFTVNFDSNWYLGKNIVLPEPKITSSKYSAEEVKNARVEKFYRVANAQSWKKIDGDLLFDENGYVEFKYIVTLGETKKQIVKKAFVRDSEMYFDFETYYVDGQKDIDEKSRLGKEQLINEWSDFGVTDAWAHDGNYSLGVLGRSDTSIINGFMYSSQKKVDGGFDTVLLWAYSESDIRQVYICFDNKDGNWVKGYFDIKKGEHLYQIKLDKPLQSFFRMGFWSVQYLDYYVDSISLVKSADITYPKVGSQIFADDGNVTFKKPTINSVNPSVFPNGVQSEVYKLRIADKNGRKRTYDFEGDELTIRLEAGEYQISYIVEINGISYTQTFDVNMRELDVNFVEPQYAYFTNVDYELQAPVVYDESVTIRMYYRKTGTLDWTELTRNGDVFNIRFTDFGKHEIKAEAVKGSLSDSAIYEVYVRTENTIFDFEKDNDGTYYGFGEEGWPIAEGYVSDKWSADGDNSFYVTANGQNWFGSAMVRDLGSYYNAISVTINSGRRLTGGYESNGNGLFWIVRYKTSSGAIREMKSNQLIIEPGIGTYTFYFEDEFREISHIRFNDDYITCTNFYLDKVMAMNVELAANIEDLYYADQGIEIKAAQAVYANKTQELTAPIDLRTELYYRVKGASEWIEVAENNGVFTIDAKNAGTYEINCKIYSDGVLRKEVTKSVSVIFKENDNSESDIKWEEKAPDKFVEIDNFEPDITWE